MLGRDLMDSCTAKAIDVAGFDLPEIDITQPSDTWDRMLQCDWLVNCAAYTDVDRAESERDLAVAVNRDGPGNLARWCSARGVHFLHVSTDYVFDGVSRRAYHEEDPVNPLGVYGQSKLEGEKVVRSANPGFVIVRTQALFGLHGRNFVDAISRKLETGPYPLRVVDDQSTCPTFTVHLARAILRLIEVGAAGTVHVSASGECTWYDFAREIAMVAGSSARIDPVGTAGYPRPARRPAYAVLAKDRFVKLTGRSLPDWRVGLREYMASRDAGKGKNP